MDWKTIQHLVTKHSIASLGAYEAAAIWTGRFPTVTSLLRGKSGETGLGCMSWKQKAVAAGIIGFLAADVFLGWPPHH